MDSLLEVGQRDILQILQLAVTFTGLKKKIEFQLALGQVHPVINRPQKSGYINGLAIKGVLK